MFQLPHDRLDDVLIHAVEEGDFRVCYFIVQALSEEVVDEVAVNETLFSECSVTATMVSFCCNI